MWVAVHMDCTGSRVLTLPPDAHVVTGKRVTYQQRSEEQAFHDMSIPGQPEKVAKADVEMFQWIDEYGCESIERCPRVHR
jgi:hypothetical protein